ncbi:hypothetical protein QO012_002567 [Methylobacterium aerolatum]|uniref:Uncharacterized protein n=1 Tax=Methylobacterium aerolatum TaxID=418708 RepID=A0ABU0I1T7_9HYPH|nr:hypothetical protein [Methylobacterium aerolatum]GJD36467.1 hypothetical protein FMGBMHLM_3387 [Methylobacterium aerolatum]
MSHIILDRVMIVVVAVLVGLLAGRGGEASPVAPYSAPSSAGAFAPR